MARAVSILIVRTTCAAALLLLVGATAFAQSTYPPLGRTDFNAWIGPQHTTDVTGSGFGNRQNGWAWSMAWFKGKLYVGTSQSLHCMEFAGMQAAVPTLPIYPPKDPDIQCTPDPTDLPSGAEIWQYDPATTAWTRVFKSPEAAADGAVAIPSAPGKYVAPDVGFRHALVYDFTDKNGNAREILIFSGVSAGFYLSSAVGSARLLWTEDGTTFNVVPRTAPIFQVFKNASFRGAASYNGKFYVIAGAATGQGVVLESSDPTDGSSYKLFTPPGLYIYEMAPFNGYLYLGTNNSAGFEVYKTTGSNPARPLAMTDLTLVMTKGGDQPDGKGNVDAISLHEFNGRLYVGGNAINNFLGAELFRITPGPTPADPDTWELISGKPRTTEGKLPLSGFGPGMGWIMNEHMWRMETFDNRLYLGTFDISTQFKNTVVGPSIESAMGFDFFDTADGVNWSVIDRGGFVNNEPCLALTGPLCQGLNFGIRTMKATPLGLFVGTANYYYGLQIWLGTPPGFVPGSITAASAVLGAPSRLYAEKVSAKRLLSWAPVKGAASYQIFRADATSFWLPDATGTWMTASLYPKYKQVGTSTKPIFVDTVSSSGLKSTYIVKAVAVDGTVSAASNVAPVPNLGFVPTVASVSKMITSLAPRFATPQAQADFRAAFNAALGDALNGKIDSFVTLAAQVSANTFEGQRLLDRFSAEDLSAQLTRLIQRLQFVSTGQLAITSVQ